MIKLKLIDEPKLTGEKHIPYYIELKNITIDQYKKKLQNSYLIPSQLILREEMDSRFETIKNQ